jgi:hypothetical protein
LRGYESATGRTAPEHVAMYAAVGLLRLAPHPFRNREVGWPERTAAMLDRAEELLRQSPAPLVMT